MLKCFHMVCNIIPPTLVHMICSKVTKMIHKLVTVSLSFIYRVLLPKADGD